MNKNSKKKSMEINELKGCKLRHCTHKLQITRLIAQNYETYITIRKQIYFVDNAARFVGDTDEQL